MKLIPKEEREKQLSSLEGKEFVMWSEPYKGNRTRAVMRCNKGHEWSTMVSSLLSGKGCPHCAGNTGNNKEKNENKLSNLANKIFIKWDGEYKSSNSKALMKCNYGHEWSATVKNLLNNHGCPKCSGCYNRTKEEQEYRFTSEFGFSFIEWVNGYVNNLSNAKIKCSEGHEFSTNFVRLTRGKKCPKCQGAYKNSEKDIIKKINETESTTFISWELEYKGVMSKAVVKCDKGHVYSVRITNILNGHGCQKCKNGWVEQEEREKQLNSLDGKKFVKWEDGYENSNSKAVMRCNEGHEWSSLIQNLINGHGCPVCSPGGFRTSLEGTLYILRSNDGAVMKIGISNSPKNRHLQLRKTTPFKFTCIEKWNSDGQSVLNKEKELLRKYEKVKFNIQFDGSSEWRKWDPEIINDIRKLQKDRKCD